MLDIYVINLKDRIDRKNTLIKLFETFKNINLIFIEAVKHEIGSIGCSLSHKKCIQIAKDNNFKNIIVIEDDCAPVNIFEEKLINIKNFLETYDDWDIF